MTATVAALSVAFWLVLQIPIGIAIGSYIRHAQRVPQPCRRQTRRYDRRPFAASRPRAVLLRG